jgi:riboflavin kinase/FMN adenylyltransferase
VSSTALREALAAGELERAARLLGRTYTISGRVVGGDGLGRKLGFPTANVHMKHNRPPLMGIFAVRLHVDGDVLPAVASLGVRPTVKQRGAPVLEVHVLDFAGDLYRRHVRVEFLQKLRDEEKYADLATLTRQIAHDVENARMFFARAAAPAPRRAG